MRRFFNKIYLSLFLTILSILTMVATTYAWIGFLNNTSFEQFDIVLESNETPEYGMMLSLDGLHFYDEINPTLLKRYLLNDYNSRNNIDSVDYLKTKNGEYNKDFVLNDASVDYDFRRITLTPVTTVLEDANTNRKHLNTSEFTDILTNRRVGSYLSFDFFITIYKIGDTENVYSDNELEVYLNGDILSTDTINNTTGLSSHRLYNSITFPMSAYDLNGTQILGISPNGIEPNSTIDGVISVDPSSVARVALEKYPIVQKEVEYGSVLDQYKFIDRFNGLYIYQNNGMYPTVIDEMNKVYDFGGILPSEYNFAKKYYDSFHGTPLPDVPQAVLNRGDKVFDSSGEMIISADPDTGDHVTVKSMARFKVYFWFEGWDSDCFEAVDKQTVKLNLSLSTKSPQSNNG